MSSVIIIEVVILVMLVALGVLMVRKDVGHLTRKRGGRLARLTDDQRMSKLEQWADKALRDLHCDVKWETEGEERVAQYEYQNGHFTLRIIKTTPFVRIFYPFCLNTNINNMHAVRTLCNRCNLNSENVRTVYTVNEVKNEIDLHLIAGLSIYPDTAGEVLTNAMSDIFGWHNFIIRKSAEWSNGEGEDLEQRKADHNRELFLVREQEMRMQGEGNMRVNNTERLTLDQFLIMVMGIDEMTPLSLEVTGPHPVRLEDANEIAGYDLRQPLFANGSEGTSASALLRLLLPGQPRVERLLSLVFNHEGTDEKTSYFRVTGSLIPLSASTQMPYLTRKPEMSHSVLMAFDHVPRQQQIEECNYLWKEAVQKVKNGKRESLTEEQRIIADCTEAGVAQMLFRGKRLFLQGRYYEALLNLENSFRMMQPSFDGMNNHVKETFYDVIYYIGFCYMELHQYERAQAYLAMLQGTRQINYTKEYVNALVNSGDFRALGQVEQLINNITYGMEEEDPPPHIKNFLAFLNRRKVYLLIDKGEIEEARKILNQMLDDPESSDFAINELAYLQRLEKER